MESEEDLFCPMVSSWLAIPAAICYILALHFIVGVSGVLLYIVIGVLSVGLLAIALITTFCFVKNNLGVYKIVRYMALLFAFVLFLFVIGFFFGGVIYFFSHFSEITFFGTALKFFGVMLPLGFLICILLGVVYNKEPSENNDNIAMRAQSGEEE